MKDSLFEGATAWGVAGKITQAAAAPVTAFLILVFFTPTIQGYYYSFASLLALQIFLELGLATVITTFSSHEWVRLRLDAGGRVIGDEDALKRLSGLALVSFRWYLVAGLVLLGILALGGTFFLGIRNEGASVGWQTPWLLLCIASALAFPLTPIWALLQGCGQINEVYRYRFVDGLGRSIVLWSSIAAGAGLWSAGLTALFSVFLAAGFLWLRYRKLLESLLAGFEPSFSMNWWQEVFPLQWRIAVSWMSGFFAFYLFTPAIFYFEGPEAAGQMGITWVVASGISTLASTWVVLFLASDVLHQISVTQSTYLRAFKREPFMVLSLVFGALIASGTILLTPTVGVIGPAISYLLAMIVGLAMATRIFLRARKEWTFPRTATQ